MIAWLFSGVIIASLVFYHGFNVLMVALAWLELRRQRFIGTRRMRVLAQSGATLPGVAAMLPGITVIVPAFNESVSIVRTVGSILRSAYPHLQVIVVSDGLPIGP